MYRWCSTLFVMASYEIYVITHFTTAVTRFHHFQDPCAGGQQYWGGGVQYRYKGDDPLPTPQPTLRRVCECGAQQPEAEVGRWKEPWPGPVLSRDAEGEWKVRGRFKSQKLRGRLADKVYNLHCNV